MIGYLVSPSTCLEEAAHFPATEAKVHRPADLYAFLSRYYHQLENLNILSSIRSMAMSVCEHNSKDNAQNDGNETPQFGRFSPNGTFGCLKQSGENAGMDLRIHFRPCVHRFEVHG